MTLKIIDMPEVWVSRINLVLLCEYEGRQVLGTIEDDCSNFDYKDTPRHIDDLKAKSYLFATREELKKIPIYEKSALKRQLIPGSFLALREGLHILDTELRPILIVNAFFIWDIDTYEGD